MVLDPLDPLDLVVAVSAFAILRPGDVIDATIEGLGAMRTPVVAEAQVSAGDRGRTKVH